MKNLAQLRGIPLSLLLLTAFLFTACAAGPRSIQKSFEKDRYEKTLQLGKPYLEKHPEDVMTRRIVGDAAFALGDTMQAYDIWKPAAVWYIDHQPRLGRRLVLLALERNDVDLAAQLLRHDDAYSGSPILQEARKGLSAIVEKMRIDAIWDVQRGDSALAAGEYEDAWQFYEQAKQVNGIPETIARDRAVLALRIALHQGRAGAEEALGYLDEARGLWPGSPLIGYVEGLTRRALGQEGRAEHQFSTVAGLDDAAPWSQLAKQALEELRSGSEH